MPFEAVAGAVADLKRTKWGQLTDNFLWWNLRGGTKKLTGADPESDDDWKAIEHNAALAARICNEAGLKGLLFDTEQYRAFPGTKAHYPFGKTKADVLRKRGEAWMRAVQKECPDIVILFTFAWEPDLDQAGFLAGVKDFINGTLDGIEGKARLVHGYENTFYYGQTAGWPSGTKDTIWSNLPLALATSEEYVWCWSEHTNFLHTLTASRGAVGIHTLSNVERTVPNLPCR